MDVETNSLIMATGSVPVRSIRPCTRWRLRADLFAAGGHRGRVSRSYVHRQGPAGAGVETRQLRELANEVLGEEELVSTTEARAGGPIRREVSLATIGKMARLGCIGFGGPRPISLCSGACASKSEDGSQRPSSRTPSRPTNLLPGPASTQLAIYCAWRLRRTSVPSSAGSASSSRDWC